jgi:hypothetical protein
MPITVISDARNSPLLKLSVKGTFKWIIEVDPPSFNITTTLGKDSAVSVLTLHSNMNGLKVSGVSFLQEEKNQGFSWKSSFPLVYSFSAIEEKSGKLKLKQGAAKRIKEYAYSYMLTIKYPRTEQASKVGDVTISTNHPEKPEIKISGNIVIN